MQKNHLVSITYLCSAACLLLLGCTTANPDFDPALEEDDGQVTTFDPLDPKGEAVPEGTPASDPAPALSEEQGEQPPPAKPADPPPPEPPPAEDPPPPPPAVEFGQLCTGDCPDDQRCVFTTESATKGMCLQACSTMNEPCEVPDPIFYSGCAKYTNPDIGELKLCAIFCYLKGESFPCPNETDYKCKNYGPEVGICVAK